MKISKLYKHLADLRKAFERVEGITEDVVGYLKSEGHITDLEKAELDLITETSGVISGRCYDSYSMLTELIDLLLKLETGDAIDEDYRNLAESLEFADEANEQARVAAKVIKTMYEIKKPA